VETKTQTVAVEMTYDKATKNKYVFAAPTRSGSRPLPLTAYHDWVTFLSEIDDDKFDRRRPHVLAIVQHVNGFGETLTRPVKHSCHHLSTRR